MFLNKKRLIKLKEKRNIKALCRTVIRGRNEKIWMEALDYLFDLGSELEWRQFFSKLTSEKQNYCINILIHRLTVSQYKENSLNIIKEIGEAAVSAVIDTFYQHVNTIRTTKDFERLQNWLEKLLNIIIYINSPQAADLFIDIYEKTSNEDVKYMVLESLGQLGGKQAVEFIKTQLFNESIYIKASAIKALGLTKSSEVVSVIIDELQQNNNKNSFYTKSCLKALIDIGDKESIKILSDYLHKEVEYGLKEQIAKALLKSPYIKIKDVETWFKDDVSYEVKEILIKTIVLGNYRERISEYIIEYIVKMCFEFYGKGNDMYIWGVRLLKNRKTEALEYLVSLYLNKEYKNLKSLNALIAEFKEDALPYLKAVYPLVNTYEEKANIISLMSSEHNYKLARFFIENIDDIHNMFSMYIIRKDEERILELIEIIGKGLKDYNSEIKDKALKSTAELFLSKCFEADYRDEERFYIKILYHFYKHFYFEELETYFIDYLNGNYSFWKYAVRALQSHKTDRAKDVLYKYEDENLNNFEII